MDFEEIKEIIESEGGKFIIVEQGKPILVVTSYEDYREKKGLNFRNLVKPGRKTSKPLPKELEEDELKIEDLPF